MKLNLLKLAYYSPTGTTKAIVQGVARGLSLSNVELIDITKPDVRKQPLQTSKNDLLVVAVPVYIGRVPAMLNDWLNAIKADKTPAVCIVVYGNRAYDDALLELKDILIKRGCIPIACAAYIGEHSYSSSEIPLAKDRPDMNDLNQAELFGRKINEKLRSISLISQISNVHVPGTYPYGGVTKLWDVDFLEVSDQCAHCGVWAEVCPADAVSSQNSSTINIEKCITCCACIRNCPQSARTMKPGQVRVYC